jgi:hypothetical protein
MNGIFKMSTAIMAVSLLACEELHDSPVLVHAMKPDAAASRDGYVSPAGWTDLGRIARFRQICESTDKRNLEWALRRKGFTVDEIARFQEFDPELKSKIHANHNPDPITSDPRFSPDAAAKQRRDASANAELFKLAAAWYDADNTYSALEFNFTQAVTNGVSNRAAGLSGFLVNAQAVLRAAQMEWDQAAARWPELARGIRLKEDPDKLRKERLRKISAWAVKRWPEARLGLWGRLGLRNSATRGQGQTSR